MGIGHTIHQGLLGDPGTPSGRSIPPSPMSDHVHEDGTGRGRREAEVTDKRAPPIRILQPPGNMIDADDMRIRLRAIVKSEHASCQILQLELSAALQVANPSAKVRKRAEAVLSALRVAEQAYGDLLTDLNRIDVGWEDT